MTPKNIKDAAAILADLRLRANGHNTPLDDLPPDCRPQTLDDAYTVQDDARALLETRGMGPAVGWKIGCTTPVMQEYLAIPHPCAGTLYRKTVYADNAELKAADFFQLGLECEIAVKLSADIPARSGGHSADTGQKLNTETDLSSEWRRQLLITLIRDPTSSRIFSACLIACNRVELRL
jgi:2-oxo-3-hexenedioate decarboxylase/2-keto-4-pentenoate hydratase